MGIFVISCASIISPCISRRRGAPVAVLAMAWRRGGEYFSRARVGIDVALNRRRSRRGRLYVLAPYLYCGGDVVTGSRSAANIGFMAASARAGRCAQAKSGVVEMSATMAPAESPSRPASTTQKLKFKPASAASGEINKTRVGDGGLGAFQCRPWRASEIAWRLSPGSISASMASGE